MEKNSFDLIILDIMMPGMNGYETCMKIRSISNTPYEFQADSVLLKRVFSNLFSNVIKYADKKVPVQIEILAGAELRIIIRNHIKARQGQVESSCIGLKSVEKIMKLMDGDMEVKEEEGKFTVELCLI